MPLELPALLEHLLPIRHLLLLDAHLIHIEEVYERLIVVLLAFVRDLLGQNMLGNGRCHLDWRPAIFIRLARRESFFERLADLKHESRLPGRQQVLLETAIIVTMHIAVFAVLGELLP